ncbi:hypothetical protein ACQEU3_45135 [Spirillospora sp. CA-253888]
MPASRENEFKIEFKAEIRAELELVESSDLGQAAVPPPSEWLFDPTDVEREEVELRNLLSAVEELEGGLRSDERGDA